MIILPAERQKLWGPLAVANFVLGGMGAGAYVTASLLSGLSPPGRLVGAASVLPVVIGFLCVAVEAGRPFRGPNVLRMVRSSWMSRELWAGGAFILFVLADMVVPAFSRLSGADPLRGPGDPCVESPHGSGCLSHVRALDRGGVLGDDRR
ncbi:MAG: dimethyl sulfoxide reductase anchor subunit [Candidatus Rokubacteria bacterium]|nr:dimethyl sulfoxide reductase anchor subunit [Candidatus Rokubacteria bacterium]